MAGLGDGLKIKYEPIYPQAPIDNKFHYYETLETGEKVLEINNQNFKLVSTLDELKEFLELSRGKTIGFDTETTGLTYIEDKIVGFSLSVDPYSGIYVPIRHQVQTIIEEQVQKRDKDGNLIFTKAGKPSMKKTKIKRIDGCDENLPDKEALDILYEILTSAKLVLAHNSEFDLNMLKFEGYNITKINCFDVLILPYLYDPEATAMAGLKALEKRVLGRTVPEFKDVLGKEHDNFALVKPSDCYLYACYDSAGVLGVFQKMFPKVKELLRRYKDLLVLDGKPYDVLIKDNQLVTAFVDYYGHAKILIDREKAIDYMEQLKIEQQEVVEKIFSFFDVGVFNLSASSHEFKRVMGSKKVFTGVLTDKNAPSWSKKAAGDMKRNLSRFKDGMQNWKKVKYAKGRLDKSGMGLELSRVLLLYGKDHFTFRDTKPALYVKTKNSDSPDYKEFWLTIKKIYQEETEKLNVLELVHKNNSLNKALNSYVDKLTQVDECYMKYRLKGTKSGRLSSGNGSKSDKRRNRYYIDLNAQNLTKPKSDYYSATRCDKGDPEGILGWKFKYVNKDYAMSHLEDEYIVEGQDHGITIRGCLKAPEGEVKYACVPDENGKEEKEVFELELENGTTVVCCKDTVFKVMWQDKELFMTLQDIMKRDDVEIISE